MGGLWVLRIHRARSLRGIRREWVSARVDGGPSRSWLTGTRGGPRKVGTGTCFSYTSPKWEVGYDRHASRSVAAAAMVRFGDVREFPRLRKLHSPRTWFSTCARQLLVKKEDRTTLGRRAPDCDMPGRYDRAVCATELRLRNTISEKARGGWRPAHAFEVPQKDGKAVKGKDSSSAASTLQSSTASSIRDRKIENISYLGDVPAQPFPQEEGKTTN